MPIGQSTSVILSKTPPLSHSTSATSMDTRSTESSTVSRVYPTPPSDSPTTVQDPEEIEATAKALLEHVENTHTEDEFKPAHQRLLEYTEIHQELLGERKDDPEIERILLYVQNNENNEEIKLIIENLGTFISENQRRTLLLFTTLLHGSSTFFEYMSIRRELFACLNDTEKLAELFLKKYAERPIKLMSIVEHEPAIRESVARLPFDKVWKRILITTKQPPSCFNYVDYTISQHHQAFYEDVLPIHQQMLGKLTLASPKNTSEAQKKSLEFLSKILFKSKMIALVPENIPLILPYNNSLSCNMKAEDVLLAANTITKPGNDGDISVIFPHTKALRKIHGAPAILNDISNKLDLIREFREAFKVNGNILFKKAEMRCLVVMFSDFYLMRKIEFAPLSQNSLENFFQSKQLIKTMNCIHFSSPPKNWDEVENYLIQQHLTKRYPNEKLAILKTAAMQAEENYSKLLKSESQEYALGTTEITVVESSPTCALRRM